MIEKQKLELDKYCLSLYAYPEGRKFSNENINRYLCKITRCKYYGDDLYNMENVCHRYLRDYTDYLNPNSIYLNENAPIVFETEMGKLIKTLTGAKPYPSAKAVDPEFREYRLNADADDVLNTLFG